MKKLSTILLILLSLPVNGQESSLPLQFRLAGPEKGGRVTAVSGVTGADSLYYMGATGGGIWKTTDYGMSWQNISDGWFASPSIGAIAVSQVNPKIIYAGTGSDAIRSNVIVGKGIYRSDDGGDTWKFSGLSDAGQIGSLIIHPDNTDKAYAAVIGQPFRRNDTRGVYRTSDGGVSWENVLFLSDSVGAVDLEFAPDNPDIIYAAMWRAERKPWTIISGDPTGGVFKSIDGGESWEKKTRGLPGELTGKIDFAVSPAAAGRLWAQIQAPDTLGGIYRSDDYGETWEQVKLPEKIRKDIMYRPFYFTNLDADPTDADHIWAGTKKLFESFDAGSSWQEIPITHADHHDLWINPRNPRLMIEGNDGGASITRDGGKSWSHQYNQPTAELYSCYTDTLYPFHLYSGQQDNGTVRIPSKTGGNQALGSNTVQDFSRLATWEWAGGCETGPVIPKPGDPDIIYANCKGKFSVYNRTTGKEFQYPVGAEDIYGSHPSDLMYRFQRVTPMEVSPHDPDVVYFGSQFLHRTRNGGLRWETISPDLTARIPEGQVRSGGPVDEDITGEEYYSVLYAIEESPVQPGVIWTGSNDGLIHVTTDHGATWSDVTPPDLPPGGRVSQIDASPHFPDKALVAVYRDYLGDDAPYIYRTLDFGRSWKLITEGIDPAFPARVVREDPMREGLLYAGTEFGLYLSFDDGNQWESLQQNLPVVPVTDLSFVRRSLALSTMGRSFWVLDDRTPLLHHRIQKSAEGLMMDSAPMLTGEPVQLYFVWPGQHNPDELVGFTIKKGADMVAQFTVPDSLCPPGPWGYRRVDWDGRRTFSGYTGDITGPFAAPGTYEVLAVFPEKRDSVSLEIRIHPHLASFGFSETDLLEQEKLALKTGNLLVELEKRIEELEQKLRTVKQPDTMIALKEQLDLLKKGPRPYDQRGIADQVRYLHEFLTHAPQKPGKDKEERYQTLFQAYQNYIHTYE